MKRLQDKVAIITGAGSGTGMGAVIARVFARRRRRRCCYRHPRPQTEP